MARKKNIRKRGRRAKRGFASWAVWKKALAIAGGTVVLLTTAGVAFAASKLGKLETTTLDASKLNISTEVEHNETGYLNVALFGLDTREGMPEEGERSDTIIIASLNRENKEVRLCSVFRDTLLQQDDGSYNKANAAYSFGGPEEAIAMLNKNLDMDIQHYVTVNFNALVDVVDELGGIELDLTPEEVFWTNGYCTETSRVTGKTTTELTQPGKQILDGVQATSYCRIRYTTGDDFKRAERQRTVLEQIVKKAQTADLSTINRIIDKVFPKIETNFSLTEILAYAKDAFAYNLTEMSGFPFDNSTASLSGVGSSVIPETLQSNVLQLHEFFFGNDGYSPSSTVASISTEIGGYAMNTISDEEAATYEPQEGYYYGGTTQDSGSTDNTESTGGTGGGAAPENTVPESGGNGSDTGVTGEQPESGAAGGGTSDQGSGTEQ
ncbi:LCP family protein [Clostridium sp. D5]|uniref:LCP family protein n=1 Tax=Clostridium sp. D5 TaxID=556261 RepID=UPI00031C1F54|nr:LCP family protein [Clostridium sp. D5]